MTAYANFRNVLATIAKTYTADCELFYDNTTNEQLDEYCDAFYALQDWVLDTDRSPMGDHTSWGDRFHNYVERAARTASKGNEDFVAAVLADLRDEYGM